MTYVVMSLVVISAVLMVGGLGHPTPAMSATGALLALATIAGSVALAAYGVLS